MSVSDVDIEALVAQEVERRLQILSLSGEPKIKSPWDEVRDHFTESISKFNHLSTSDTYQLVNALSTVLRHSLGIRMVRFLKTDQKDEGMKLAEHVLEFMERNKPES